MTEIRKDGVADLNRKSRLLNMPGLNPNSLRSAFAIRANMLLTAIRQSGVNIKPGGLP